MEEELIVFWHCGWAPGIANSYLLVENRFKNFEPVLKEAVVSLFEAWKRTVRSETTKDKTGVLPPALYSRQLSYAKVTFHDDAQDDSVAENREGIEQNKQMPPSSDHDHGVTFMIESVVAVVADITDLTVEYDTDS